MQKLLEVHKIETNVKVLSKSPKFVIVLLHAIYFIRLCYKSSDLYGVERRLVGLSRPWEDTIKASQAPQRGNHPESLRKNDVSEVAVILTDFSRVQYKDVVLPAKEMSL